MDKLLVSFQLPKNGIEDLKSKSWDHHFSNCYQIFSWLTRKRDLKKLTANSLAKDCHFSIELCHSIKEHRNPAKLEFAYLIPQVWLYDPFEGSVYIDWIGHSDKPQPSFGLLLVAAKTLSYEILIPAISSYDSEIEEMYEIFYNANQISAINLLSEVTHKQAEEPTLKIDTQGSGRNGKAPCSFHNILDSYTDVIIALTLVVIGVFLIFG